MVAVRRRVAKAGLDLRKIRSEAYSPVGENKMNRPDLYDVVAPKIAITSARIICQIQGVTQKELLSIAGSLRYSHTSWGDGRPLPGAIQRLLDKGKEFTEEEFISEYEQVVKYVRGTTNTPVTVTVSYYVVNAEKPTYFRMFESPEI
jgi:hypothetical protein